jgi:hypothetical protein
MEIITLLVVETNRYYHQLLDSFEDGPSPQREVTEAEIFRCVKCDVALCVDQNFFQDYHTKTKL